MLSFVNYADKIKKIIKKIISKNKIKRNFTFVNDLNLNIFLLKYD